MGTDYPRDLDDIPCEGSDLGRDAFEFSGAVKALAAHLLNSRRGRVAQLNTIVSIEAEWGWGKTSFANLLVAAVQQQLSSAKPTLPESLPLVVRYNAWLSGPRDGSHWAPIALRIGQALYSELHERLMKTAEKRDGPLEITLDHPTDPGRELSVKFPDREQSRHPQTRWTDIAWQLSEAVNRTDWHPCLALFSDAPSKLPGRGFSGREGRRTLGRLATRVLTGGIKADQVGAAGAALAAAGSLVGAYADDSGPAAPESDEFVGHLGALMRVLRRDARGWRIVLVVEDAARLDEDGLAGFLEALAYLRHLRGVLVLICLDRRIADRVLVEAKLEGGEGRLTKTIDLRQRVPAVTWSHRHDLILRWCQSIELPVADEVAHALGRWCFEHGQQSPRQIKRLLRWLDIRLRGLSLSPRTCVATVRFVASLYRHDALGVSGEVLVDSLDEAQAAERLLLELPHQPWDSRAWPELAVDPGLVPETTSDREWIGSLRRFALIVHLLGPEHPNTVQAEQRVREARRRHLDRLAEQSPWVKAIAGVCDGAPDGAPKALLASLLALTQRGEDDSALQLVRAWRAANVVAAMRSMDMHGRRPSATVAGVCGAWAQGHDLLRLVRQHPDPAVSDLGLLILALLHGKLYDEAVASSSSEEMNAPRDAAADLHEIAEGIIAERKSS